MTLTTAERSYIKKRERLTRYWPFAGGGILALLFVLSIWLWIEVPHMINPWAVSASLKQGILAESTASLMAAILPVIMLTLLIFAGIVVILAFVAFANEHRLIRLVRRLDAGRDIDSSENG